MKNIIFLKFWAHQRLFRTVNVIRVSKLNSHHFSMIFFSINTSSMHDRLFLKSNCSSNNMLSEIVFNRWIRSIFSLKSQLNFPILIQYVFILSINFALTVLGWVLNSRANISLWVFKIYLNFFFIHNSNIVFVIWCTFFYCVYFWWMLTRTFQYVFCYLL